MGFLIRAEFPGKPPVTKELVEGGHLVLGRAKQATFRIPEDLEMSRLHAEVLVDNGLLVVRRNPESTNPVFRDGRPMDEFGLAPGESFLIGKTKFTFLILDAPAGAAPEAVAQSPAAKKPSGGGGAAPEHVELLTMSAKDLYAMGDPAGRLKYSHLLEIPEILRKRDRKDSFARIAAVLRDSTDGVFACVVTEEGGVLGEDRSAGAVRYQPSKTLIRKACAEAPQPTVYSWSQPAGEVATRQAGLDWAVCAAARIPHEPSVVFYVAGSQSSAGSESLQRERARFVGLIADMVGRSMAMDRLTTWEGRLERFFAGPVVNKILSSPDLGDIEPRLAVSTVMFFDIRGFSKRTEEKNEDILQYIGELRRAMTAMTAVILEEQGVVLQYMGDGILACWNVPFQDLSHVDLACRASLRMAEAFSRQTGGWRCGIGLHSGEVVAGAIGSEQVFSYGLLGATVNQASRVEGITKALGVGILATEDVASKVSPSVAMPVPVGRFRPAGMSSAIDLFELTPAPGDSRRREAFQGGVAALKSGDFAAASLAFGALPAEDKPAAYLRSLADKLSRTPPRDWDGVIELSQK
ncbi:MAG: adenylate/guanylate cyclase domain-containing protein [Elusimicrobia bacterium]|nr:adenylate/guanylate cyclase domain-containing protein [Elusimicrobiota bacterium]